MQDDPVTDYSCFVAGYNGHPRNDEDRLTHRTIQSPHRFLPHDAVPVPPAKYQRHTEQAL